MNNNDILRRLRFAFDFSNQQAVELFSLDPSSSTSMSQANFLKRLAKDDDDDFLACSDVELCAFLDGLIVSKRGLRDDVAKDAKTEVKPDDFRMSKKEWAITLSSIFLTQSRSSIRRLYLLMHLGFRHFGWP